MKVRRLQGFILRHVYPLRRDFDLLSDMVYWPLVDTLLWGITSQWFIKSSGIPELLTATLSALILWNVIWRAQAEVSRNLIDEIWNNNLVNLFSTPFSVNEWIVGVLLLSVIKTALTVSILTPVILMLYSVNVLAFGWWLVAFFLLTGMTGWWIGFISAGIVLRWGPKVQTVVWTLPGALLPFSAVYFPLDQLPLWIKPISLMVPTTYVFESMRSLLLQGSIDPLMLLKSLGLNLIFLAVAITYFLQSFKKSKELGLGRFN